MCTSEDCGFGLARLCEIHHFIFGSLLVQALVREQIGVDHSYRSPREVQAEFLTSSREPIHHGSFAASRRPLSDNRPVSIAAGSHCHAHLPTVQASWSVKFFCSPPQAPGFTPASQLLCASWILSSHPPRTIPSRSFCVSGRVSLSIRACAAALLYQQCRSLSASPVQQASAWRQVLVHED